MARKSNKTAHVLNLLAGHDAAKDTDEHTSAERKTSDDTTAQTAQGKSGETVQTASDGTAGQVVSSGTRTVSGNIGQSAAAPVNTPAPPSIPAPPQNNIAMIDKTEDDPVAELIQQKLSSEFEKQIQQSRTDTASNPTVGKNPKAVIDAVPVSNSDIIDIPETAVSPTEALIQEAAPVPQATATPASAVVAESVHETSPDTDFVTLNVMENIVNDKIIYFMRQFHVCTCSRCKADVIALTLNGLIPKYIVTMKTAVDPLLSYYTNRLISDVTVEATKACMIVKENPRH